jgi:intein-encoded DNA endonuclease-like protein
MSHTSKQHPPTVNLPVTSSPFYLSAEVRSILRCSKRTLIRLYKGYRDAEGKFRRPVLGSMQRGGRILFEKSEVSRFITARTRRAA